MGRENTASTLSLSVNYGVHLTRAGQTLRAAEVYRKILNSAAANGRIANRYLESNYAGVLVLLGRYQEATTLVERALAAATAAGNTRAIAGASVTGANAACAAGDLQRCESQLASAGQLMPSVYPKNHKSFSTFEFVNARLSLAQNDPRTAREHLRRALEVLDASTEHDSARVRVLALLVRVELQLSEQRAAMDHAVEAVAAARQDSEGFAYTEWLGVALLAQGIVQKESDAKADAQATLREALTQLQGAMGEDAPPTREARALLAELTQK